MMTKIAGKWHFRRVVPSPLRQSLGQREIWLSLQTGRETVARARAGVIYGKVENLFQWARMTGEPTKQDLMKLLDDMSATYEGYQTALIETHELEKKAILYNGYLAQLDAIKRDSDFLAEVVPAFENIQKGIRELSQELAEGNKEKIKSDARAELLREQFEALQDKIINSNLSKNIHEAHPKKPQTKPVILSDVYIRFTELKRGSVGLHTLNHFNATYGIFSKFSNPDADITQLTRESAGNFITLLRQLPQNYGKAETDKGKSLDAIVASASKANPNYRTLSAKTMRGHIHTLTAIWKYAQSVGMMPKSADFDIWSDHLITPLREITTKRRAFLPSELQALQATPWTARVNLHTIRQILTIATFSGMRLEEICRLRPMDIYVVDGVMCFHIRAHKDPTGRILWDPKTEAGERVIPLHPYIIQKAGLLERVKASTAGGHPRIFNDLNLGPLNTYGDVISKTFGRWKVSAGLPAEVTFHSFRHGFRTALGHRADGKHYPTEWIDQLLGHESAGEGSRYNAGTTPKNLVRLVKTVAFDGWEPMLIRK